MGNAVIFHTELWKVEKSQMDPYKSVQENHCAENTFLIFKG